MKSTKDDKEGWMSFGSTMAVIVFGFAVSYSGGCMYHERLLASTDTSPDANEGKPCAVESPLKLEGEHGLETSYTSKQFHVKGLKESASVMVEWRKPENSENGGSEDIVDASAGQHLLVDIKNVDPAFLDDAACLADALVSTTNREGFPPLLSHHCHSLLPSGVSCVGVAFKGHFSFHTWPEEGVITLDIYNTPAMPIGHLIPILKEQFGVKNNQERAEELVEGKQCSATVETCPAYSLDEDHGLDPPRAIWKLKLRGFRKKLDRDRPEEEDISDEIYDNYFMDYIEPIATVKSIYQQIDIVDIISPKKSSILQYERSISSNKSTYEAQHPELFLPQRIVYLDGVAQSNRRGDEPYHETLVQPALFAHSNPRRAVIIGGGEGATLREVLRHNTIEHVKMVEIDQVMAEVSRKYLPSWSDCSDIIGSTDNCFDEPRADVLYEDAIAWFSDRTFYPPGSKEKGDNEFDVEQFDVVIVDALDPQDINNAFSDVLYSDPRFLTSLYNALTPDGIMVMQLGPAPEPGDPDEHLSNNKNRPKVFALMQSLGFETVQVYEEVHCGFENPWSFMIGCKSVSCRDNWYSSAASVQVAMHERLIGTKSGAPSLKFFDGATMSRYHGQSRAWETVFCRDTTIVHPECQSLAGFDSNENMISSTKFEVTPDGTLVANVDIQEGDLVMTDQQVENVHIPSCAMDIVDEMEGFGFTNPVSTFRDEYSIGTKYTTNEVYAASGKWNFANKENVSEANTGNIYLDREMTDEVIDGILNVRTFNPVISRRYRQAISTFKARKRITAGEPISF